MSHYMMDKTRMRARNKRIYERIAYFGESPLNLAKELAMRVIDVKRIYEIEANKRK